MFNIFTTATEFKVVKLSESVPTEFSGSKNHFLTLR